MNHNEIDFTGYIDGTLDEKETEEIKAHLKNCLQCREMHRLLLSCDNLMEFAVRHDPALLCPGVNTLIRFLLGALGPEESVELKNHLQTCTRCEEDVAKLEAARAVKVDMPDEADWEDLPQDLADLARSSADPLLEKLKNVFYSIKEKGSQEVAKFVDEVSAAAESILSPPPEPEPVWAAEKKNLGFADTDISIRDIDSDLEMELEIENHQIKITRSEETVTISVEKDGKPVPGITLKIFKEYGAIQKIVTGKDGEGAE